VRRFPQALADVQLATKLAQSTGEKQQARSLETSILAAMGRYDDAMPRLEKRSKSERSTKNLAEQGALYASLGMYREAEGRLLEAEVQFRGLSPLGLVDVWFERARMWERAGSVDQARPLYVAAHRKMRHHVPVLLRLASLSSADEGIAMLEPFTAESDSPRLLAQLGVLQNQRAAGSGDAAVQRARAAYDEAYLALPEAFAESGAHFFLGPGADPARAVSLAKKNAEVTATTDAFELLIMAALASKDTELLCSARQGARRLHRPSPSLKDRLAQLEGKIDCAVDGITPAASSSKPTTGR
jgi:tetratricopeptide (TPR) repeat protein